MVTWLQHTDWLAEENDTVEGEGEGTDVWCGVVWCGVVWCGVVWCDWCGVVWQYVAWCGVMSCGVLRKLLDSGWPEHLKLCT